MSNLAAVRSERRLSEERGERPAVRRLGTVAAVVLLIAAVVLGLAEVHLLPSFSADDFGSILFGAG